MSARSSASKNGLESDIELDDSPRRGVRFAAEDSQPPAYDAEHDGSENHLTIPTEGVKKVYHKRGRSFTNPGVFRRETYKLAAPKTGVLTTKTKILYALPQFSVISLTMLITIHLTLFYVGRGCPLEFIAFFTAFARSFDVLTDPMMAWYSDKTRTRWGRRRPYFTTMCFGYAVAFILLMSPGDSLKFTSGIQVWYATWYICFYIFDTIANVPYTALGPELTDDSRARTSLFMWSRSFTFIGTLMGAAAPAVLSFILFDEDTVFTVLATFFSTWYVIAMILLGVNIRERKESLDCTPSPLVPSVRRSFNNRPFRPLLIGWILDYVALSSIASMFPFFVNYVVINPRDICDPCNEDCTNTVLQDPTNFLAVCMGIFFIMALLAVPVWNFLANKYDKRNIWLAYNLVNTLTNFMYIFIGRHHEYATIIITLFNGIPVGGQFLIESVLADVIDYDEFLNFSRTEGAFTVFATFIPKLVSIPAQSLPLAIISAVGFIQPYQDPIYADTDCRDSRLYAEQPDAVKNAIRVIFVGIPCLCTAISFFVKLKYPIKRQEMVDEIAAGIQEHMRGNRAKDPLTDKWVVIDQYDERQQELSFMVDHFPKRHVKRLMLEQSKIGRMDYKEAPIEKKTALVRSIEKKITTGLLFMVGSIVLMATTFGLLTNPKIAWVPAVGAIGTGLSLCYTVFNTLRLKPAKQLSYYAHENNSKDRKILEWLLQTPEERRARQA